MEIGWLGCIDVCWLPLESEFYMSSTVPYRPHTSKSKEDGLTDNIFQTIFRIDRFAVITSSSLETFGDIDDVLKVLPKLVQGLHTALSDHYVG